MWCVYVCDTCVWCVTRVRVVHVCVVSVRVGCEPPICEGEVYMILGGICVGGLAVITGLNHS